MMRHLIATPPYAHGPAVAAGGARAVDCGIAALFAAPACAALAPADPAPPPARNRAIAAVAVLLLAGAAIPFARVQLPAAPGTMIAFGSAMIVINAVLAALLFARGSIERSRATTWLGSAYLFVAMILMPGVACCPDALAAGTALGTSHMAAWLWSFGHAGFALCIFGYGALAARPDQGEASPAAMIVSVLAAVTMLTVLSTSLMPAAPGLDAAIPGILLVLQAASLVLVCRLGLGRSERRGVAIVLIGAGFDVLLTTLGAEPFSLGWYLAKGGSLFASSVVLIALIHELTRLYGQAASANLVLAALAHTDGLTGLCNRRRLDELLATEFWRSERECQPLSVLMIDVDYFKSFNDRYGHLTGDTCLRSIAAMLSLVTRRPSDTAARYGGEEFLLLLPGTDAVGAVEMAERVRAAARALAITHAGSPLGRVTLSIGAATVQPRPGDTAEALIAEADQALYRAKNGGRDRACWADDAAAGDGVRLLTALLRGRLEAGSV